MALDYTTRARVKTLLGIASADVSQDSLLDQLIQATSMRFDAEMRRHSQQTARTEVYPIKLSRRLVTLQGAPVNGSVAFTVKLNDTTDFTTATTLVRNDDYVLEDTAGVIRLVSQGTPFTAGSMARPIMPYYIQVTYTGGFATSTANLITGYPDIAQACDLQVAYLHRRRTTPGGNVTMGESSTQYTKDYQLLDEVRQALSKYKRLTL
jgi:hypothetical protein